MEFLAEQSPDVFPTQGDRDRYMSLWDGCELVNALFLAECERDPSGVPHSWGARWEAQARDEAWALVSFVARALGAGAPP